MEKNNEKLARRKPRRKVCHFCVDRVEAIDYKDVAKLRKFILSVLRFFPAALPAPALSTRESLQQLSSVLATSHYYPM